MVRSLSTTLVRKSKVCIFLVTFFRVSPLSWSSSLQSFLWPRPSVGRYTPPGNTATIFESVHCLNWPYISFKAEGDGSRPTFEPGYLLKTRNMAISAAMVLPEPVGAPSRTFVSVWYSVWKICVWMGLKWVNLYRLSNSQLPRAVTGNGCRSSSSVTDKEKKNTALFFPSHEVANQSVLGNYLPVKPEKKMSDTVGWIYSIYKIYCGVE